jgi:hypothetical protein
VFHAQRPTADGTLLLVTLPGEEVHDGFDREWNGSPAKVVPDAGVSSTFSIQTHAGTTTRFSRSHRRRPAANRRCAGPARTKRGRANSAWSISPSRPRRPG